MSVNDKLKKSKVFCMMPWIHMHIWPNGNTFPCCMWDSTKSIGNVNELKLDEVWNSKKMKTLRKNMLNETKTAGCTRCYELEESDVFTLRKSVNESFQHHIERVKETSDNGAVDDVNMSYMDIRFSNICNFRCRTCGPELSTAWYDEHKKLFGTPNHPKLMNVDLYSQIEPLLMDVEEVYWAGGEVLITEQHYDILDYWIKNGKKDVRHRYTTNFSVFNYKKKSILDYWNYFDDVRVAASLDAEGKRGEYIRNGTDWDLIVRNREKMIEQCPDVYFEITPTISIMNVFDLPNFHKNWVESGLLDIGNVRVNILTYPDCFRIQNLPDNLKEEVIELYNNHISWIENYGEKNNINIGNVVGGMKTIITFLNERTENKLDECKERLLMFDKSRNENFREIFPELDGIW
jgi:radical SAM protein with 4Fe4S-binding SPASM domain